MPSDIAIEINHYNRRETAYAITTIVLISIVKLKCTILMKNVVRSSQMNQHVFALHIFPFL